MGVNVFLSRPSSMLAALPFVRLPAERVWIEFSNLSAREALARYGNDNKWIEGGVFVERMGYLITEKDRMLEMEAFAQYRDPSRGSFIELLTAKCQFDMDDGFLSTTIESPFKPHAPRYDATGKAARYYAMLASDEREHRANEQMRERFSGRLHGDFTEIASIVSDMNGPGSMQATLTGHIGDMYRLFTIQILPALILLNCRNAVDSEYVPASEKLNKARRKKGKPEIGAYKLVKLHLTPKKRMIYGRRGETVLQTEGGLVMGHFKVRSTGIFWWSPHWRGPTSSVQPKRVHVLTR